jgi:hypothetical protein
LGTAISHLGGIVPEERTCHLDAAYDRPACPPGPDRPGLRRPDRRQGRARPHPGRAALARGANALLDERLRQAAPDDRPQPTIVEFYLYLAAAFVTVRQLIQRARRRYRWDSRPTTKRLK